MRVYIVCTYSGMLRINQNGYNCDAQVAKGGQTRVQMRVDDYDAEINLSQYLRCILLNYRACTYKKKIKT